MKSVCRTEPSPKAPEPPRRGRRGDTGEEEPAEPAEPTKSGSTGAETQTNKQTNKCILIKQATIETKFRLNKNKNLNF